MNSDKIGIFLVTRNRLLGEALTKLMREKGAVWVMGAAPFSPETTERISSNEPDVLLLDSTLDALTGLEIVPEVRRCAVLSMAINKYFYTILGKRSDGRIQVISSDLRIFETWRDIATMDVKGSGLEIPL